MIQHVNGDEPNKIVSTGENWYPKKKEVIPRVYHKYLNQRDKDNIYNHLGDHIDEKEDKEESSDVTDSNRNEETVEDNETQSKSEDKEESSDTNIDGKSDEKDQNGHDKEEISTESAEDTTE